MADPHLDDELVSELLDADPGGEVGVRSTTIADAEAHVAVCDRCRARLETFVAARAMVAEPFEPAPGALIDQLITTAVDAYEAPALHAPVVPIASRRRLSAPPPVWLVAVAAAFMLLLAVPALLQRGEDDGSQGRVASSEGLSATEDADDGAGTAARAGSGADAAAESEAAADAGTSSAMAGSPDAGGFAAPSAASLGPIDDIDELVRRLTAALSTGDDATRQAATPDPGDCEAEARRVGGSRLGSFVYAAALTWQGQEAVVLVFGLTEPSGGASRQAYVMAQAACAVLAEPRF